MVRLFVGGLPPGVTVPELLRRFESFGKVHSGELAPDKLGPEDQLSTGRGFGYVELEPTNEAALKRCISTVAPLTSCAEHLASPACTRTDFPVWACRMAGLNPAKAWFAMLLIL